MKRYAAVVIPILLLSALAWGAEKDSYLKKADRELQEWSAKVDALEKKSEKAGAKTRVELDRAMRSLREKVAAARKELTHLQDSGDSGWKSLRRGTDEAIGDVKRAYRKAASSLKSDESREP